ncbi:hypothetical protein [Marivita sp. GX14005]|nr:hypothetical protein [Marivita sp. GX14005]MCL3883944.1 hypothetical protein [Marivita sp. GX14005]
MAGSDKTPKQNPEKKTPPRDKDDLHRPEDTLGEAPAGSPNAEERSRLAD